FETRVVFVHVSLGVGSGVQLPGVTSPWGLGRGIHAADTPATGPTPSSTDFCDLLIHAMRGWISIEVEYFED
ncbi:hypothetical protein, partial [Stenotrophomonas maltophilia]